MGGSRYEGTFSGVLPNGLHGLLSPQQAGVGWQCGRTNSIDDCMVLPAPAAPDAVNTSAMRDQGLLRQHSAPRAHGVEVHVSTPFSMEAGESVLHVAAATGAHISIAEWPRLWLQGSEVQVKTACELLGCSAAVHSMGPV